MTTLAINPTVEAKLRAVHFSKAKAYDQSTISFTEFRGMFPELSDDIFNYSFNSIDNVGLLRRVDTSK
jgi:hypothetical protein